MQGRFPREISLELMEIEERLTTKIEERLGTTEQVRGINLETLEASLASTFR